MSFSMSVNVCFWTLSLGYVPLSMCQPLPLLGLLEKLTLCSRRGRPQ